MEAILLFVAIIALIYFGFAIYYNFKQIEFVVKSINLSEKMINRQDMIIKLLKDIRGSDRASDEEMLSPEVGKNKMDYETYENGRNTLMDAAVEGEVDSVKVLLDKGADVNAKDNDSTTALMDAALGGYIEVVQVLLDAGADTDAKDSDGRTAMMWAKKEGHDEIVELLKQHGAKE